MAHLDKYLARHGNVASCHGHDFVPEERPLKTAVIIPAMGESASLPNTLASLAQNPGPSLERTLVIVVVNNPPAPDNATVPGEVDGKPQDWVTDNQTTLRGLEQNAHELPLHLVWIDKSSPGAELPANRGVGLARKIGADTFLSFIQDMMSKEDRVQALQHIHMLHLDADTRVDHDYLPGATTALEQTGTGAVCLDFEHAPAQDADIQRIILAYELFLHYYVAGLDWADSPYAFHTIGSTMACTASAYVRALGMPQRRLGAEDFYFLQKVAKQDGVATSTRTTVHPSPRPSDRVPMGTGPHVRAQHATAAPLTYTYNPHVFAEIKNLYNVISEGTTSPAKHILPHVQQNGLANFLQKHGFTDIWEKLQKQHSTPAARLKAFHQWFDGLMLYKAIRCLSESSLPRVPLHEAWDELMQWRGDTNCCGNTTASRLAEWRRTKCRGD